ncbi:hypothetical protein HUJ05_007896, partial [Dendroctonus ponderosae]
MGKNLDGYIQSTRNMELGDKRDESCLNRDLDMLKQLPHETAQKFYDKCLELLNLLYSHVDAYETAAAAATFLSGLRQPLGTVIRCMRPNSLTDAIQLVIQEEN